MAGYVAFCAALLGLLGVALGAFGAHALKARLGAELLAAWETAVQYQLWHALAALAAALFAMVQTGASRWFLAAGWLFVAGAVVFSGSLYLMALTGVRALGAVTPVGGLLMLAGWGALAWGLLRPP